MGEVGFIEDGHPEVAPMAPGWEMGNFIVVKCADFYITLANLRAGSFYVQVGEPVSFNRALAVVGNSGDRTIPHLHMHVTVGGWEPGSTPVPVLFDTASYEFSARARNHLFAR
jgi:murein DD-endopeptidase MepM/ murein hydrolase activator NlpD